MPKNSWLHRVNHTEPQTLNLPKVGRCIYCGGDASEKRLTREHIIPDALGGVLVLPDASCLPCAAKINRFEQPILKRNFGVSRLARGIKSRKRRGKKQKSKREFAFIEGTVTDDDFRAIAKGEKRVEGDGDILKYLSDLIVLEKYHGQLGIYSMADPKHQSPVSFKMQAFQTDKKGNFGFLFENNLGYFEKFLAKIGHGMATAVFGPNGFDPFLSDYIINDDLYERNSYHIGSFECGLDADHLHRAWIHIDSINALAPLPLVSLLKRNVVVCDIQFFCDKNPIVYRVVVGEPLNPKIGVSPTTRR